MLAELVLRHGVWETFHVKVASLLGALVLDGLTEAFGLTVGLLESLFNVELLVVRKLNAVDHRLSVEVIDSKLGTSGSIFTVLLVLRVEADESIGALVIPIEFDALDAAVLAEKLEDVLLCEVHGEVLGIDVVVDFAEISLVTGLVSDDLVGVGIALSFKSLLGAGGVLEAYETIATGGVI